MSIDCLSRDRSSERGAVIVMVALWLPVLALFLSFAVDFAHFFDYSRNLQNRADAAALAAGNALGGTCFGGYTATRTHRPGPGKAAQQYSGPPDLTVGRQPALSVCHLDARAVPERPEPQNGDWRELPRAFQLDRELGCRRNELEHGQRRRPQTQQHRHL